MRSRLTKINFLTLDIVNDADDDTAAAVDAEDVPDLPEDHGLEAPYGFKGQRLPDVQQQEVELHKNYIFFDSDDANVDDDGTAAAVDAGDDRLLCLIYLKSMMAWGTSSSSLSSSQVKT